MKAPAGWNSFLIVKLDAHTGPLAWPAHSHLSGWHCAHPRAALPAPHHIGGATRKVWEDRLQCVCSLLGAGPRWWPSLLEERIRVNSMDSVSTNMPFRNFPGGCHQQSRNHFVRVREVTCFSLGFAPSWHGHCQYIFASRSRIAHKQDNKFAKGL